MHKDPEAAAALVSACGETPGALGPLVITQSMRSLFRLTAHSTTVPLRIFGLLTRAVPFLSHTRPAPLFGIVLKPD